MIEQDKSGLNSFGGYIFQLGDFFIKMVDDNKLTIGLYEYLEDFVLVDYEQNTYNIYQSKSIQTKNPEIKSINLMLFLERLNRIFSFEETYIPENEKEKKWRKTFYFISNKPIFFLGKQIKKNEIINLNKIDEKQWTLKTTKQKEKIRKLIHFANYENDLKNRVLSLCKEKNFNISIDWNLIENNEDEYKILMNIAKLKTIKNELFSSDTIFKGIVSLIKQNIFEQTKKEFKERYKFEEYIKEKNIYQTIVSYSNFRNIDNQIKMFIEYVNKYKDIAPKDSKINDHMLNYAINLINKGYEFSEKKLLNEKIVFSATERINFFMPDKIEPNIEIILKLTKIRSKNKSEKKEEQISLFSPSTFYDRKKIELEIFNYLKNLYESERNRLILNISLEEIIVYYLWGITNYD